MTDNYYTAPAIRQFEKAFPGRSKYYVLSNSELRYISNHSSIIQCTAHSKEMWQNIKQASLLCIYGVNMIFSKKKYLYKTIWFLYGGEFWNNPEIIDQNKVVLSKLGFKNTIKSNRISSRVFYYMRYGYSPYLRLKRALKGVKYCAFVNPFEVSYISKVLRNELIHIPYTYSLLEEFNMDSSFNKGCNVWVGHSASQTNNHIDLARYLIKIIPQQIDSCNRELIIPLGKGGDPNYIMKVKQKYENIFNGNVKFVDEFLSHNKLELIMKKCEYAFMNHTRQEALGTMFILLYKGVRLYIRNQTTTFLLFQKLGLFFSVIDESNELIPLTLSQKEHNRKIVIEYISQTHDNFINDFSTLLA